MRIAAASRLTWLLACALAAAHAPPSAAMLASLAHMLWLAFVYWTSMLAGAAPYILSGGLAAAVALRFSEHVSIRCAGSIAPALRGLAPVAALLFGACDCTLFGYAPALRTSPRWLSCFALTLAACCGPMALFATWRTFGARMVLLRSGAGLLAAALSALLLCRDRLGIEDPRSRCCVTARPAAEQLGIAPLLAHGFANFSCAAAIGSVVLAFAAGALFHASPFTAAVAGALISPCSTADALLARSFFRSTCDQIAFIFAAQCLDWRQLGLMYRHFGLRVMCSSAGAALVALAGACAVASAQRW
ncbi:MAG: hypothetical protein M3Z37_05435 [Candidatus Eremiobacteraeota bacterium]|nr:hypothetical protein [Candidatus Eremiobacteraeota bacterium]